MIIEYADISENQLLISYGEEVCMNLLKDHTTQKNIYWATDSYESLGEDYSFFSPITLDKMTSYISSEGKVIKREEFAQIKEVNPTEAASFKELIRPRAVKSREEQIKRSKDKAEVFTPAWICNAQNNLLDEAWFGRSNVFNSPDPANPQRWLNNEEDIVFPEGKTWKDYVADTRIEITCGEAPYLCNRYDAVTGEYNKEIKYRIGILDRKLRIVSENVDTPKDWLTWGKIALRSTYGFEWQGDNLLLAREAMFFSFQEHFVARFGQAEFNRVKRFTMPGVAYIVSWNVWQMDGLTYGLPGHEKEIESRSVKVAAYEKDLATYEADLARRKVLDSGDLFGVSSFNFEEIHPPVLEPVSLYEQHCLVKDFLHGVNLHKANISNKDFSDRNAPTVTFESLVNK